jgi:WD40 repeat protein
LRDELPPTEAGSVEEHVGACPDCQGVLQRLVGSLPDALVSLPGRPGPADEEPPDLPGYEPLGRIDAGGMGVVWRVRDLQFCRSLAVKVMKSKASTDAGLVRRFVEEAQVCGQLAHPFIVPVHAMGRLPDGRPYYSMKLIEGRTLAALLEGELAPAERRTEAVPIFGQVCQAVAFAHGQGVIHRDLKPDNVMVGAHGEVQVMDWGLAKRLDVAAHDECPPLASERAGSVSDGFAKPSLTLPARSEGSGVDGERTPPTASGDDEACQTRAGSVLGTVAYMPPEQARGLVAAVDRRSDVFALGAILCQILTGEPPYTGSDSAAIHRRAAEADLDEARSRLQGCGAEAELVRLAELCLSAAKSERPADAGEVAAAVAGYLAGVQERLQEERLQRERAQVRLAEERRRRKLWLGLAAAVLVVLVAGIVGTTSGLVAAWYQRDLTEQARKDAVTSAEQAKAAGDEARRLAVDEKAARGRAEKQLLRSEWLLYASQINLAWQQWESNHVDLAHHYLQACRPDFRGWEHDYLFTLFNRHQQTLRASPREQAPRGQPIAVLSLAISPDGKRVGGGCSDKTVRVWDAATGQETLTLTASTGRVNCVAISPDGKRIVSSSGPENTAKVWDAVTGQEVLTLRGHTSGVTHVAISPDGRRIAGSSGATDIVKPDGTMRLWDAATGQEVLTLKHTARLGSVAFSPDSKRIAAASGDKTVRVWDAATGQETLTLRGHTGFALSVAFSPNGRRIVSGSGDKTVRVWDAATGHETYTLIGHTGAVYCVAYSPDGQGIVSASEDKSVKVWLAASGLEVLTFRGHTGGVTCVAFSPDSRRVASVSGEVKVWDAAADKELLFPTKGGVISRLAPSPNGQRIACACLGGNGYVQVWDTAAGKEPLTIHTGQVDCVAFSPDSRRIVTGNWDKAARGCTVKVWDAATGWDTLTFRGHTGAVSSVAFSPDGTRIASAGSSWSAAGKLTSGEVRVWDAATGQEGLTLRGHTVVTCVAFSPDGTRIASASGVYDDRQRIIGGEVKVWDAATGQEIWTVRGHTGAILSMAYSPDGTRIVTGSMDKTVKVWDATTGQETFTLTGHTGQVSNVAVMPDGKRIVSGSWDGTVKVWDAASGYETLTLKGAGTSLAVSPDGKRIYSNGQVKVWDASMSQQKP